MTDWRIRSKTEAYKDALKAAELIEAPSKGFVNQTIVSQKATMALIKQNNTLIQLLVKISENLDDWLQTAKDIKKGVAEKSAGTFSGISSKIIEELKESLQKLSLGEPIPKQKSKPAPFYVFKNPQKILEEEKHKASK